MLGNTKELYKTNAVTRIHIFLYNRKSLRTIQVQNYMYLKIDMTFVLYRHRLHVEQ